MWESPGPQAGGYSSILVDSIRESARLFRGLGIHRKVPATDGVSGWVLMKDSCVLPSMDPPREPREDAEHSVWFPERLVQTVDSSIQRPEDESRPRDPADAVEAAAEMADS